MPGVPDWVVPRPRITKLIAQGTRWRQLTVVTGAAGETMALALWAAAQPVTVAWVGLDEFDNRPGTFWANVVAAPRRSGVAMPPALPAARRRDAGHVFLLWLAAALAAQGPPVTLVLDDLHRQPEQGRNRAPGLCVQPIIMRQLSKVLWRIVTLPDLASCERRQLAHSGPILAWCYRLGPT